MPAAVVLTVVVAAVNSSGVMDELSGQQRQHGLVGVAADTGVQPDVGPGYGSLRTRADAAADQRNRQTRFASVDFPPPEGPTKATVCPG